MTQLEVSKEFTLSSLEPDWNEDIIDMRFKTSMRTQGSLRMTLMKASRNPESSRPYVPGDPIHLIDWKAFARTDQVTLRQHRDEASQHVEILIDIRSSMKWPDFNGDRPISKSDLAIRIGLWVAHTHMKYGDTVVCQLVINDGTQSRSWRPKSTSDINSLFASIKEDPTSTIVQFFDSTKSQPKNYDRKWILTDGLEDIPGALDVFSQRPRCTLIHTLSSLELSTDWMESETCYLERTPTRKDYLGKQLKQGGEFETAINDWKRNYEESTRKLGFEYFQASDLTPALSLFHFVRERAQI